MISPCLDTTPWNFGQRSLVELTVFGVVKYVCYVLHEYPTLQLQTRFPLLVRIFVSQAVLRFVWVNFLTT